MSETKMLQRTTPLLIAITVFLLCQPVIAADLYWDANGNTAGTGGTGTWTTANTWRNGSPVGALQTWADSNNAHFQGTAGIVSITSGTTVSPVTSFFEVTNYTLRSTSTALTTLAGSISLSASVNLNYLSSADTTDRQLAIGSVSGGAGSSLTFAGGQTASGNNARIFLNQANESIDVPITISGVGSTFAGFVASSTGTGITGTIANSSNFTTLLGAANGNDLTLSSTAVISGSAGVKIGVSNSTASGGSNAGTVTLNAANTYLGGTTLQSTGTLVLGNDSALGNGGTFTIANSAGGTISASSTRNISNPTVLAVDAIFGGANDLTFSGSFTSSGALTRTLTVNNSATTTLSGNVFLSELAGTGRTLVINGTGATTISGVIANFNGSGTAGNLTYSGSNTLKLTNANTYTGATAIGTSASGSNGTINAAANGALGSGTTGTSSITVFKGGTLILSNASATDRVRNDAPITLGGANGAGTATIQRADGGNEGLNNTVGLGALTLAANSSLNYGGATVANGTLTFASFTPSTFTLSISGYDGVYGTATSGVDGTNDRLIFDATQASNLSHFAFVNPDGLTGTFAADQIDLGGGFFEIVPVPEPSTWIGGGLALATLLGSQRKRFARLTRWA